MNKNIPNVILQDYLKFIEFILLKKIVLLWNSEVIDTEVKEFFSKNLILKSNEKGKQDIIIDKEERIKWFSDLIRTFNEYVLTGNEIAMYSSFYDVLLADKVNKFYLHKDHAKIEENTLEFNLTILSNILEINYKYEIQNYKRTPILSSDVEMIGSILSIIIKTVKGQKNISQWIIFLLEKVLNISYREELFKEKNKKPEWLSYLSYDLSYYDELILFYKEHKKLLTDKIKEKLVKIYMYLRNPDTIQYSNNNLEKIEKIALKYETLLKLEEKEIHAQELKDIYDFLENKNKIKKDIKQKIIGQDNIIDSIIDKYLPKIYLWMNNRPISFLFLWKSWTGKTELGKQIAEILNTKHLHIPLGNFNDKHTQQTLLWAPPSYIGYWTPTIIEKYVSEIEKENNIPVIIFDEIEKWTNEFQNIFLELLDEWKMTLLSWKTLNLQRAIIILTSNLWVQKWESIWFNVISTDEEKFELSKLQIENAVQWFFRKEIFNRISDTFIFNELSKKTIEKILKSKVKLAINRIKENKVLWLLLKDTGVLNIKEIIKELEEKVSLDDIENIRKIEAETENILAYKIENYVMKK